MDEWRSQLVPVDDIASNRNNLINKIKSIKSLNLTPIAPSLYEAARYLTAIDSKHNTWEMRKGPDIPSPITQECQPTHMVLLTDGVANWSWKNNPGNVTPKQSDADKDRNPNATDPFGSINGPNSYDALPNELQNLFDKLLDNPVVNLPALPSDTPGKMIFDGKHSDFANPAWAGKDANDRLCKMRGSWRWIPINEGHGDGGTTTEFLYDEFRYAGDTDCAFELAYWMNTTDQSPGIANKKKDNTITTHTIGFALTPLGVTETQTAQEFLRDLAKAGGGGSYTADTKDELKTALENIVSQVLQVDSATFVNPTVPREHFKSELENKNEVYYPLFRPGITNRWAGNLKKYRLDNSSGLVIVRDAQGEKALNDDNSFKSASKSYWSTAVDGHDIAAGGAAEKLPDASQRNLFVILEETATNTPLPLLKADNDTITTAMLGIQGSGTAAKNKRKELLNYVRGFSEDGKTTRRTLGDPLHSAPTLFSYCSGTINSDGQCQGTAEQMVVMGSNEGFVHMFDTNTGIEQFAVMPQALLKNIKTLKADENLIPSVGRPYGMDNTVTLWVDDKGDKVNHVYAYASMRRGGRGVYALDISNKNSPKLLWQIIGGSTPGFERLGQTWSQPVKAKIKISGIARDVLIFGGGYDNGQDEPGKYQENNQKGNAIYIVDAITGSKLWEVSSGLNVNLSLSAMKYSIPGKVRVVDLDNDGLADQLFFADTGGQVWRLFINNADASNLITAKDGGVNKKGVLAQLGSQSADSEKRRFYHEPGVAFVRGGTSQLYVNIGSGYRAHPLDTGVQDKFYSIQVPRLSSLDSTLTDASFLDVSARFDSKKIVADIKKNPDTYGWKITFSRKGEKVLSTPGTRNGQLFFNTYVPGVSSNPCYPAIGNNYTYAVDLENGAPLFGTEREQLSNVMGIAGDPVAVKLSDKLYMQVDSGSDNDDAPGGDPGCSYCGVGTNGAGKKTYWMDVESE